MLIVVLGLSLLFLSACGLSKATSRSLDTATGPLSSNNDGKNQEAAEEANVLTASSKEAAPSVSGDVVLKDGEYQVDTINSQVAWGANYLVGATHTGFTAIKSGQLEIKNNQLMGGSFTIDMAKISNDQNIEALVKHLSSDDFFSTATYPEARLVITSVPKIQEDGTYLIAADLTIKNKTAPVTFNAKITSNDGLLQAVSSFSIDRTIWDIKYRSGKFFQDLGDKVINDEIKFNIKIQARQ